jgi:LmbE family N-acetylglucosaminyl deacetylase
MSDATLRLHLAQASVLIPDGMAQPQALQRTTHLGIGAHPDDLEFMAFHGILACHTSREQWFCGVTCTNGAGSLLPGSYATYTPEQIIAVRQQEQRDAALIGNYGAMLQLGYTSAQAKQARAAGLVDDLKAILLATRPKVIYTHNLLDKHDTHLAVAIAAIISLREVSMIYQPERLIGCEVWRDLDWLANEQKVVMDVSGADALGRQLNRAFASQQASKNYDEAVTGRRAANACFGDLASDSATQTIVGIDLLPLLADTSLDITAFALAKIDAFRAQVAKQLGQRVAGL